MHRVAIGMPVWNGEKYISEAIESILGQTFGDLQLVISDNASTDGTGDICRSYVARDRRVQYIRQDRNIGAAPNHNYVFHYSSGEYFKFAAHDDVLAPEFIEDCVRILDDDETVVLCSPATALINEDGSPVSYVEDKGMVDTAGRIWPVVPENNPLLTSADPADRFAGVLLNMFMALEIFGLIRRAALERTALQPPHLGGDKILLAELAMIGRYYLHARPLFYRRCHSGQYSAAHGGQYMATWFSGKSGSVFSHQLRLLVGYTRVALTADIASSQRYRCLAAIWRRSVTRGQPLRRMFAPLVPVLE
jgi:glycosyltransferase involved in cell wall biosynthesis